MYLFLRTSQIGLGLGMDFNPISYFGVNRSISVSDYVAFQLLWFGGGSLIHVVLKFKGCHAVFVLYERVYSL